MLGPFLPLAKKVDDTRNKTITQTFTQRSCVCTVLHVYNKVIQSTKVVVEMVLSIWWNCQLMFFLSSVLNRAHRKLLVRDSSWRCYQCSWIQTLKIQAEVQHGWWTVTRLWGLCSFHVDSVICETEGEPKAPIKDEYQSLHQDTRKPKHRKQRHCALCRTWQTAGSDDCAIHTANPTWLVVWVAFSTKTRLHSNHVVISWGDIQKPSVSYDIAEQVHNLFTWRTLRVSLGYLKYGEKVYKFTHLQLSRHPPAPTSFFFQPWTVKHWSVIVQSKPLN